MLHETQGIVRTSLRLEIVRASAPNLRTYYSN